MLPEKSNFAVKKQSCTKFTEMQIKFEIQRYSLTLQPFILALVETIWTKADRGIISILVAPSCHPDHHHPQITTIRVLPQPLQKRNISKKKYD